MLRRYTVLNMMITGLCIIAITLATTYGRNTNSICVTLKSNMCSEICSELDNTSGDSMPYDVLTEIEALQYHFCSPGYKTMCQNTGPMPQFRYAQGSPWICDVRCYQLLATCPDDSSSPGGGLLDAEDDMSIESHEEHDQSSDEEGSHGAHSEDEDSHGSHLITTLEEQLEEVRNELREEAKRRHKFIGKRYSTPRLTSSQRAAKTMQEHLRKSESSNQDTDTRQFKFRGLKFRGLKF